MGKQRGRSLKYLPGPPRVEAVYDVDRPSADKLAHELGCVVAGSVEELLQRPGIGVVIVAVPHWLAKQTTIAALRAGKHVLCEKPLGLSGEEAAEVVSEAEARGLHLTPGFNYRYYPGFRAAARAVREGRIGKLTHIRCEMGHGARPGYDQEWKTKKALCGGGALLDPGVHMIDLIRHIAGEIQGGGGVLFRSFWNIDVEDNAFVHLETERGCIVQMHISITEWRSRCALDLFGQDGCVQVRGRSGFYGAQTMRVKNRWDWLEPKVAEENCEFAAEDLSFAEEMKEFWQRLEGKEVQELASGDDGRRALEVVERIYQTCPIRETIEPAWRQPAMTAI